MCGLPGQGGSAVSDPQESIRSLCGEKTDDASPHKQTAFLETGPLVKRAGKPEPAGSAGSPVGRGR